MIRRNGFSLVSSALLSAFLILTPDAALAQAGGATPAGGGGPAAGGAQAKPAPKLDAKGKELAGKVDALSAQAAVIMAEYRKALEARVEKLAQDSPTLSRLKRAGVFSMNGLLAGVPSEPLSGLPEMRRVYETLDETADHYVRQFGGVAKSRAEAAAVDYLKKIIEAQELFREDDKDGNGTLDYARTFHELGQLKLLHVPASVKKGEDAMIVEGYRFQIVSADLLHWAVVAAPADASDRNAGDYYLYGDETKVVRAEKGRTATRQSPVYDASKDEKRPDAATPPAPGTPAPPPATQPGDPNH